MNQNNKVLSQSEYINTINQMNKFISAFRKQDRFGQYNINSKKLQYITNRTNETLDRLVLKIQRITILHTIKVSKQLWTKLVNLQPELSEFQKVMQVNPGSYKMKSVYRNIVMGLTNVYYTLTSGIQNKVTKGNRNALGQAVHSLGKNDLVLGCELTADNKYNIRYINKKNLIHNKVSVTVKRLA